MIPSTIDGREPFTTSGTIAVANLHAQIDGLAARLLRAVPGPAEPGPAEPRPAEPRPAATGPAVTAVAGADWGAFIDLLTLRGQVLGRVADYGWAAAIAEQLVRGGAGGDGTALLARARSRATFHRFADALGDLDAAAARGGADHSVLEAERAVILQATGSYAEAERLHRNAVMDRPGFATLGALAVFQAERGEAAEAEGLFDQARQCYQGISPFPVASLDYRRGLMWHREGNLAAAAVWLGASRDRVPAYAPAVGLLAEIDAAAGANYAAIRRLLPLVSISDDPAYAAGLARALRAVGHHREAGQWHSIAAARYDELVLRHPQAYADHAADFRRLEPSLAERQSGERR
jgi:tetratricopeptide (TPR) repeat protein